LTDLDGCLAGLGLDYDSEPARDVARCLAAAAAAHCDEVAAIGQLSLVRPPAQCPVPGLAALAARPGLPGRRIELGFTAPGSADAIVDALLGAEACGIAPVFSAVRADGRLRSSTMARLSGRGLTPEAALALSLSGDHVLPEPGRDAWLAMHRAVSAFAGRMPPLPEPRPAPAQHGAARRELPVRRRGFTEKAAVGGHRVFLQTGEFEDGSIGELAITPPRETPAMRGLMDAFARSVSLGLQHGVTLDTYVEAFAYTRFGPAGAVDGDGSVGHATSLLDYAFRTLSEYYLGRKLPDAETGPETGNGTGPDGRPLLPLDLPAVPARHAGRATLRVVGGRE
ncbi:MAG: vitamin B12-dependent ribonucleotide reductase, partial [Gluconacetobacter diazotrophicus]|nr:vitamin B12-dependent ribonucleotide reductase [Gluconacetobacter diazotrophicus]